jgi:hypothetical protein
MSSSSDPPSGGNAAGGGLGEAIAIGSVAEEGMG